MRRKSLRAQIEARAEGHCEYCQAPQIVCGYRFHLDHIVPVAIGGSNEEANLALACASCNLAKSDRIAARDPISGEETLFFHPRRQHWKDHFCWEEDRQTLLGITATGRATLEGFDLNSELRQKARAFWFEAGLLPRP